MAMNFPELKVFSLPPMSFSDFCLFFVLLVLRKGFVVEIFAICSGTLLIFAVCSFPSLPESSLHMRTIIQLSNQLAPAQYPVRCGFVATPCPIPVIVVRVLTREVLPTAPESRTKYELQRGAEQEVLMLKEVVVGSGKVPI